MVLSFCTNERQQERIKERVKIGVLVHATTWIRAPALDGLPTTPIMSGNRELKS